MNKIIADLFSFIINILHVVVFGGGVFLLLTIKDIKEKNNVNPDSLFYTDLVAVGILVGWVLYILIIGVVATILRISENLEEINEHLKNK